MILKKLEITAFGKFKNKTIGFSEGLNIIRGDNESGKTTIINFIFAMLYGFGDNRGKGISLREKYTPWDGGVCEGKLSLITDSGENITIYRKAGNAKKYDVLRIYNSDTGEDAALSPEEIVGIGSDTFFKTLCVQQLSSAFEGSNSEIVTRLSNITSSGDENISYEKAVRLLENVRREIKPQRGTGGELSKISEKIAVLEKEHHLQQSAKTEAETSAALLSAAQDEESMLKKQYEQEEKNDYTSRIAHITGRIEEKQKHTHTTGKQSGLYILIAVLMLASGVILSFFGVSASIPFFILSFISFIFYIIKKLSPKTDELQQLLHESEALKQQQQIHEAKLSQLQSAYFAASEKTTKLEERIKLLRHAATEDITAELEALYKKKQALEKKLRIITLTTKALSDAHDKMQRDFTPALNRNASAYFSSICDGKYNRIFCDEAFGIKIDCDIPRDSSFFSGGTVDQLYLALRLALIDMLFENNRIFILLDQPFLQYDDTRKKNTVALLDSMSDKRQTLLFTGDKNVILPNKRTEILT